METCTEHMSLRVDEFHQFKTRTVWGLSFYSNVYLLRIVSLESLNFSDSCE